MMEWGLIVTTTMAIVNVIVLGVGGTWAISKIRSVSENNRNDILEIKESQRRLESKWDETNRELHTVSNQLAKLEARVEYGGGRGQIG